MSAEMTIMATSDLHGKLPYIGKCDFVLICGDICIGGSSNRQAQWLRTEFREWVSALDCRQVVITPGNHDWMFEKMTVSAKRKWERMFGGKLKILINEHYTIQSGFVTLKLFGTPYCKRFFNWAFMRGWSVLRKKYMKMDDDVDIMMTHDAPDTAGVGEILDKDRLIDGSPVNAGNHILTEVIKEKKPKMVLCGHIHSGNHIPTTIGYTTYVNVSYVDERYKPCYGPLEISKSHRDKVFRLEYTTRSALFV